MTASSTRPATLGELIAASYSFCIAHWKQLLLAAAVLGTISGFSQISLNASMTKRTSGFMQTMGMNMPKIQELSERMQNGDTQAAVEMQAMMEQSGMTQEEALRRGFGAVAPFMGIGFLIGLALTVISTLWFYFIALGQIKDLNVTSKRIAKSFLPLLGLWLWMVIRSFVWIPIIGLIPGIILLPRYALAPVLLLRDHKGIRESVQLSSAATEGYWGKIVGNGIVVGLLSFLALIVVGIVLMLVQSISPIAGNWAGAIAQHLVTGFCIVFCVQLSLTILQHPIRYATKGA